MSALQQVMLAARASGGGGGTDPFFSSVASLLHFDGTNGSTVITDVTGKTWSAAGGAALDTSQFQFGTASLSTPVGGSANVQSSHAAYAIGTQDFTLEFFYRPNSAIGTLFENRFGAFGSELVLYGNNTTTSLIFFAAGANRITGTVTPNVFQHVALCKASGITRLFIGGAQQGSNYTDGNSYNQQQIRIGANFLNASSAGGHHDDFRLTIGVARYTANFTPPSAAFPNS